MIDSLYSTLKMALFRHGIAVGLDLSSDLVWSTDELFNINSNINIILEGQWTESGLCQKHTYRDIFECDGKV